MDFRYKKIKKKLFYLFDLPLNCSGHITKPTICILGQLNRRFSLLLSQCDATGFGRGGLGGEEKISETITYYCIFVLSLLLLLN